MQAMMSGDDGRFGAAYPEYRGDPAMALDEAARVLAATEPEPHPFDGACVSLAELREFSEEWREWGVFTQFVEPAANLADALRAFVAE